MSQANPLTQLFQLSLQANLLKLLGQDTTTTTNLNPNPTQLLSLSSYANQVMKNSKQSSKFSNADLSNFLFVNKVSNKSHIGHEAAHMETKHHFALKQEPSGSNQFVDNTLKSITIPAFNELAEQGRRFMNSDLSEKESVEGLSSKSKKM